MVRGRFILLSNFKQTDAPTYFQEKQRGRGGRGGEEEVDDEEDCKRERQVDIKGGL